MSRELSPSLERNPDLDSWIRIDPGGRVAVFTGKAELGQGIKTAVARIAAEELDVSVERIDVHTADTTASPNELYTAGSSSIEESGGAVRKAAAEARRRILARASEQLGLPVEQLRVEDGTVSGPGGGRTSYWELMEGKSFQCRVSGDAPLKRPAAYRVVGRPGPRLDLREIVTGTQRFAQDLELPDMVHGRVVRPPGQGARLDALDAAAARRLPGVLRIVREGSFLAAIAEREEQALEAARALRRGCRWSEPSPLPTLEQIFEALTARPDASLLVVDGVPVDGPVPSIEAPASAAVTLRASYYRPYHMHASLGPSAAAARLAAGELTVWTHAQGVHVLRPALAQVLGMEPADLRVVHVPGPGCYGHNGAEDVALDAALLARALPGRPVLVKWSREDEHAWEPYGPAMVVRLQASLDGAGAVIDWNHDGYSNTHMGRALPFGDASNLLAAWHRDPPLPAPRPRPSRGFHAGIHRNADPLYAFPRRRIAKHLVEAMPLRVSSTRSLGAFANVFAIESFMDELARAAGADPIAFRLRHLEDERARDVIAAAAERSGWSRARAPGRGRGIGFARYKNQKAYAAVVVELEVEPASGAIHLERVVVAADAGQIVDPDGLANQLEGGAIQSASWTLKEEVRFDRERITSTDWESYPILTFPEAPEVETVLIDRPGAPSLGSGEAAQGPTSAAIANAVFDATGARLRRMPFLPPRVRETCAAAGR